MSVIAHIFISPLCIKGNSTTTLPFSQKRLYQFWDALKATDQIYDSSKFHLHREETKRADVSSASTSWGLPSPKLHRRHNEDAAVKHERQTDAQWRPPQSIMGPGKKNNNSPSARPRPLCIGFCPFGFAMRAELRPWTTSATTQDGGTPASIHADVLCLTDRCTHPLCFPFSLFFAAQFWPLWFYELLMFGFFSERPQQPGIGFTRLREAGLGVCPQHMAASRAEIYVFCQVKIRVRGFRLSYRSRERMCNIMFFNWVLSIMRSFSRDLKNSHPPAEAGEQESVDRWVTFTFSHGLTRDDSASRITTENVYIVRQLGSRFLNISTNTH